MSTAPPVHAAVVSIDPAVSDGGASNMKIPSEASPAPARRSDRPPPADGSAAVGSSALPRKFGRNVIMNYVAQIVTALAAIVITPLLLKHLGQSLFGVWILASSVVAYLQLFAAGFGGATTRLVAEDAAERPEVAVRTLNTTFFVLLPMGALALVVGVVLAFFFPAIVHVGAMRTDVVIAVAVLAVAAAAALPCDTFGGALLGHQRFDLLSISNALLVATTTVAGILIVVNGGGIVPLAVATTVISLSFHFVRYGMLRHIEPTTRIRRRLVDRVQLRRVTRLSGWFLLLTILTAIYNTLCDVLIVGIVAGVKAAAIYAVGSRLAKAAMQALDSMAQVFFPFASHTARNESPDALGAIAIDGTRVTLLGGTMAAIVFVVLAAPGIEAWVGPGYTTSARVLVVLAIAMALGSPFRALGNIMTGAGDLRALTFVRAGEVIINLALSVILVIEIGPLGAAFGTLGGVLLFRLPVGMILGCRAVGLPVRTLVRRAVVPHILPSIVCSAVVLALLKVAESSVVGLFAAAAAGCISYLAVYYVTGATPGDRERVKGYAHGIGARRARRSAKSPVPSADVPLP